MMTITRSTLIQGTHLKICFFYKMLYIKSQGDLLCHDYFNTQYAGPLTVPGHQQARDDHEIRNGLWVSLATIDFILYCIHYIDVIMTMMASQITSLTVVYSTVYSDADQRKHQSSASLAFVWGIHRDRLRGKCFHLMTSSCYYVMSAKMIMEISWNWWVCTQGAYSAL